MTQKLFIRAGRFQLCLRLPPQRLLSGRQARQRFRQLSTAPPCTPPPNSSSRARCTRGFKSPRSSCCPCSSINVSDRARSTSPEARRSFTQAVLRPSARFTRRRIRPSSDGIPASSKTAWAGWPGGDRSNSATTSPDRPPRHGPGRPARASPEQSPDCPAGSTCPRRSHPSARSGPVGTPVPTSMISMSRISSVRSIGAYSHSPPRISWR